MISLKKGILIAIEGIDGSGKSTLAKNLSNKLLSQKHDVLLTKEPGGTPLGQQLRTIVQEKKVSVCPKTEFLLFATDRAQHFSELIIPALEQKKIVISDRMSDSSLVYQGYGRGLDMQAIKTINTWVMSGIKPDLTIFVKIDAQIAMQRILARNAALTSFEKEKQDFIERLVIGFDTLYKDRTDVIILDGKQSIDTIATHALNAVEKWITQNHSK